MPFQVSPGVNVSEIDLTTVVPAVSTTEGALAGVFRWGPVGQRVLVDTESNLVSRFGKPTNFNDETFFTAANFLSYGNKLYVARAANTVANTTANTGGVLHIVRNSVANVAAVTNVNSFIVKNEDHYYTLANSAGFTADLDVKYVAKYPGELGNSLKISVCDSTNAYSTRLAVADAGGTLINTDSSSVSINVGKKAMTVTVAVGTGVIQDAVDFATTMKSKLIVGDIVQVGNTKLGTQLLQVASLSAITNTSTVATFTITTTEPYALSQNYVANSTVNYKTISTGRTAGTILRYWQYYNTVDSAPTQTAYQSSFGSNVNDALHIVIVDEDGQFSGTPGAILESYKNVSRAYDAKTEDGASNYYVDLINKTSKYVWFANARTGATSTYAKDLTASTTTTPLSLSFAYGTDGLDEDYTPLSTLTEAYDLYASAEDVDVSLILTGCSRSGKERTDALTLNTDGDYGEQLANYLIDNIAEKRKDCVVFVTPPKYTTVNNAGSESDDIVTFRDVLRSTSYAVLDSGHKYQYDKYNDVYRWVPLNGDVAGLCVRTDDLRDAWWSPAGFNRGQIKNIVKLAFNPAKAYRDILYKAGVNPVVTFPGQGTVLYGDKTLLAKPSAFDRINVRRLFIVLEKAIATATKFTLFEFNDDFTRAQFRNLVEPFLRDVQGRRGIYDFKVVCDTTNNTGEVIDRNEFIGDIYIKPAKSINFIQLNFIAVRTGVEFSEIVGKF